MSDSNPPVLKLPPTLIHKQSSTLIPTLAKQPTRDMELLYHKYSLVRVPSVSNYFEQETLTEYQSLKDHEFIKHFIIHPQNHFNESQLDKLYNDSSPSNTNIFHDDSGNFKQIQQQRDEIEICKLFEEYKQHENTHSPTGRKSLKCCDKDKCNWLLMKPKPLLSKLTIMSQILHVYFYHSSMYEQQKNSATNFQQRFCQYNAVEKTQLRQLENVGEMHMHKQQQIDIPQAESEPENKCELGNKCKELQFLLKYGDYKKYQSVVIEQLTDECIYAYLDHCIDCHLKLRYDEYKCYHGDDCKVYNEFSPGDNKIDTLQALIHTYFYHNTMLNELQNEEQKVKSCIKTKTKTYDDEYKIHYKKTLQTVLSSKTSPENLVRFGEPWVVEKQDAKFKNPKKEILHNVYCSLQNKDWNDVLKMSVQLIKRPRAKSIGLTMKELVALKLYTDFGELQKEYRKCYSAIDESERIQRQKQYYHWNVLMSDAIAKSKDIITNKLYHGLSKQLNTPCYTGTYFGPISTTIKYDVAKGFAGASGIIIELYPSFGKKGMSIAWLSQFPDEEEVIYMNTSFDICGIYDAKQDEEMVISSSSWFNSLDIETSEIYEQAILRALQSINVESHVISLSDYTDDRHNIGRNKCESKFDEIDIFSKLAVLHLLYIQYTDEEWNEFINNKNKLQQSQIALAKYRDNFTILALNVKAVRMERLSLFIQHFFYSDDDYQFPNPHDLVDYISYFRPDQPLRIDKIVKLFPNAQQLLINADNWDWSLTTFVKFLSMFEYEFKDIALQDIYIRFTPQYPREDREYIDDPSFHNNRAQQLLSKYTAARMINTLKQYGWRFTNSTHLHRFGFEPISELPFLSVFVRSNDKNRASLFYRTYSAKVLNQPALTSYISTVSNNDLDVDDEEKINEFPPRLLLIDNFMSIPESIIVTPPTNINSPMSPYTPIELPMIHKSVSFGGADEGTQHIVLADHNPKYCVLTIEIWARLEYKNRLMEMFTWKQMENVKVDNKDQKGFCRACLKVETVVLDPLPLDLQSFFYEINNENKKRSIISFSKMFQMFPNINEIYLRSTTFNLRICFQLIKFIEGSNNENIENNKCECKLQRIFFCKESGKRTKTRDILKIKSRLQKYGWDFKKYEQVAIKL